MVKVALAGVLVVWVTVLAETPAGASRQCFTPLPPSPPILLVEVSDQPTGEAPELWPHLTKHSARLDFTYRGPDRSIRFSPRIVRAGSKFEPRYRQGIVLCDGDRVSLVILAEDRRDGAYNVRVELVSKNGSWFPWPDYVLDAPAVGLTPVRRVALPNRFELTVQGEGPAELGDDIPVWGLFSTDSDGPASRGESSTSAAETVPRSPWELLFMVNLAQH